jgi:serine protease Do
MTVPLTQLHIKVGKKPVGFMACRLIVLVGATAVGAFVMLVGADTMSNRLASAAYAQTVQPRSGFADIVDKIKPAVISVRAKLDAGTRTTGRGALPAPEENPLERFFRQFGLPDNDSAPLIPRSPLTKAGSGFFISADGYAVTNNHVVEGVSSVEVTTNNGKVYTA